MPKFEAKSIYDEILEFSKQGATLNLLESGVDVNFIDQILSQLNSNIANGSNIDDVLDELKVFITGEKEGVGALQRYVTQVSNDSLTQFNATYNQTITQDLGIEFYQYTGTIIAGTRPFCDKFVRDYFHKKEVEELGVGIDPLTGSALTGNMLNGRIKGTNASNIFINRGGYNCRHFFSPISARFVPKKDLQRNVSNGNWKPTEREKNILKGKKDKTKKAPMKSNVDLMNELNSEARKNILIENKVRAKFGGQLNTKAAKKQFSDELNKQGVRTVEQIKEARRLLL